MERIIDSTKRSFVFLKRIIGVAPSRFLGALLRMRRPNGAFVAAEHANYEACWTRDQLYCSLGLFYAGDTQKFKESVAVVFDMFHKHRSKIDSVIYTYRSSEHSHGDFLSKVLHAKVNADTLDEITHEWGHHQLDAIGLFLYVVGFAYGKGIDVRRNDQDALILEHLVKYLEAVRYWEFPDFGMWEEHLTLHASSIGAVVSGLSLVDEYKLAEVPLQLILKGQKILYWLLPNESPDRDVDMAELSLIWPYNVALPGIRDTILIGVREKLAHTYGVNRYIGDQYFKSDNGEAAEWPMGFFWLSIISSEIAEDRARKHGPQKEIERWRSDAQYWFGRGVRTITEEGNIPEIYQNGKPNPHTPLAWAHSMALIAEKKLKA